MDFTFSVRNGLLLPCVRSISGQTVEIPYMSKNFRFDLQGINTTLIYNKLFNLLFFEVCTVVVSFKDDAAPDALQFEGI